MSYADLAHIVTFRPATVPLVGGGKQRSRFDTPWSRTVDLLARELRYIGAKTTVMELAMREQDFRNDGLPRASAKAAAPGVVLSFTATAVPRQPTLRYEVNTYTTWEDNIRAIALGLEALRAVDRYGVTKLGEQYAGWKALPAGAQESSMNEAEATAFFGEHGMSPTHGNWKILARRLHPDSGGDPEAFKRLTMAKETLSL